MEYHLNDPSNEANRFVCRQMTGTETFLDDHANPLMHCLGDDCFVRWVVQIIFHHENIGPIERLPRSIDCLPGQSNGFNRSFVLESGEGFNGIGLVENGQVLAVRVNEDKV